MINSSFNTLLTPQTEILEELYTEPGAGIFRPERYRLL